MIKTWRKESLTLNAWPDPIVLEHVVSPDADDPTGTLYYGYDNVGNRTVRNGSLDNSTGTVIGTQDFSAGGTYDENDRLTQGYSYSAGGNTLTDPSGKTYSYKNNGVRPSV